MCFMNEVSFELKFSHGSAALVTLLTDVPIQSLHSRIS